MSWTAFSRALNNGLSWKIEKRCSPLNKETTMTTFARTLDRQRPARATSPIPGLAAALLTALLWSNVAHADLDDIRRAAEAGDTGAQLELGILFEYGFNYKGNEIPALTWYTLSANQGSAKAVKLRDALKAKMTEKDVQEAMEQVAQYKPSGKPVATPSPTAPAAEAPIDFSPPPETESKPSEIESLPAPPAAQ
jgi:TPR repeat protein